MSTVSEAVSHESADCSLAASELEEFLRCPGCSGRVCVDNEQSEFLCQSCGEAYPFSAGIPRMVSREMRESLANSAAQDVKAATALSFGYEWTHFSEMRPEWEVNFLAYMSPHGPDFFAGKRVLDAGCGTGRHAYYAGKFGAEVWAMDLGPAVEVAAQNTKGMPVHAVQADLCHPPFEPASFDMVYSIGVLHHLPDPEGAFRNLVRFVKPGGHVQVYLYWKPEGQPIKKMLLGAVNEVRRVTTRLPHPLLHALCYPAAAAVYAGFVLPHKLLRRIPGARKVAERIPMKQYASYPFRVCVNDQFDRFSAPIENRYTRQQVIGWLERVGLKDIVVTANFGWCGSAQKPLESSLCAE